MLGKKSVFAQECFEGGYIGVDFLGDVDLTNDLPENWREFNRKFIPTYMQNRPDKTKIGAGLACGFLWTVCKGILKNDLVLCPDGQGAYRVGEVNGSYYFVPKTNLPHRRRVNWLPKLIQRSDMSEAFRNSTGSVGTVCTVTQYYEEIDRLMRDNAPQLVATDPVIEDPSAFAMEKHLESFLVANWGQTELAKDFNIFEEDGEQVGQQYETDAGPIDILAVSKDRKKLMVVELKRGRASDVVVGQLLRYMGFIKEQLAESDQAVEGAIIALEDDQKLRWAISMVPGVKFYRYQINFKLVSG
jgi:restriction system protein